MKAKRQRTSSATSKPAQGRQRRSRSSVAKSECLQEPSIASTLPGEILFTIFELLSQTDLSSCVQVCKSWYTWSKFLLYKSPILKRKESVQKLAESLAMQSRVGLPRVFHLDLPNGFMGILEDDAPILRNLIKFTPLLRTLKGVRATRDILRGLRQLGDLESVQINAFHVDTFRKMDSYWPNLIEMRMTNIRFSPGPLFDLFDNLPSSLENVELERVLSFKDFHVGLMLKQCGARLRKLKLLSCRELTFESLRKIIQECPRMHSLEIIQCSDMRVTNPQGFVVNGIMGALLPNIFGGMPELQNQQQQQPNHPQLGWLDTTSHSEMKEFVWSFQDDSFCGLNSFPNLERLVVKICPFENAHLFRATQNLRCLEIDFTFSHIDLRSILIHFPNLEALALRHCKITQFHLIQTGVNSANTGPTGNPQEAPITPISPNNNNAVTPTETVPPLVELPPSPTASTPSSPASPASALANVIFATPQHKKLKVLHFLDVRNLDNNYLEFLAYALPNIQHFWLEDPPREGNLKGLLQVLEKWTKLRHFCLSFTPGDEDLNDMIASIASKELEVIELDTYHRYLTDDSVLELLKRCPNLKSLNIQGIKHKFGNDLLYNLSRHAKSLEQVSLPSWKTFSPRALSSLLRGCPKLKCLLLSSSDAMLQSIRKTTFVNPRTLKNLERNVQFTADGWKDHFGGSKINLLEIVKTMK